MNDANNNSSKFIYLSIYSFFRFCFVSQMQKSAITKRSYTYANLRDHCAALATRLQTKFHLTNGDVVAVCLPNVPEYPIAVFGAIEAGCIVTTVNPIYTVGEWHFLNFFSILWIRVADEQFNFIRNQSITLNDNEFIWWLMRWLWHGMAFHLSH